MEKMNKTKRFFRKNASTILTCIGGVGVLATSVMAIKATPKALTLLEEAKKEKGEDLTKMEIVKVAGPAYIPAAVTGIATVACIFGANALNKRQQASLMSGYALLNTTYNDYKNKMIELYGEEADVKVKEGVARDEYENTDIETEDEQELFYDYFSKRYFSSTKYDVQKAQYRINRDIVMQGYGVLNDYYDYLGLDPIPGGDDLGWSEGSNMACAWQAWLDFRYDRAVLDEDLECRIIDFYIEPTPNFGDYA